MPMHDWTRVEAGIYHDFHQDWTIELRRRLNHGILPPGYVALADQRVEKPVPDIVAYDVAFPDGRGGAGGVAVAETRPKARLTGQAAADRAAYVRKANRLAVRNRKGRVVAIIEILSPGNKDSRAAVRAVVDKTVALLQDGVHVLMVDPFPPTKRDPQGIHHLIWEELTGEEFAPPPPDKPLAVAAYDADFAAGATTYVEPLAVGDALPDMPLFLEPGWYVLAPLEASYQASWQETPAFFRKPLETTEADC